MQRFAQFLLVGCLLLIPAVAQRGGGGFRGGMGGGFHGGMGGGFRGGAFAGGGFRGGFVNRGYWGFRGGFYRGGRFFGYAPYWPYYYSAYPYYGYSAYPYYAYSYYPYATYTYPYSDAYSYPYQDYGYAYSQTGQTSCPQTNGGPLYLIRLTYQDTVWLAQDYWYTPGTLNFVTPQGELKKTPMNSIDRAATVQLNRACGGNFQLPR